MKFFNDLSETDRKHIIRNGLEPYVKGAIIKLSHEKMGIKQYVPQGIYKYEGGVIIDNKEFVIKSNFVAFDWRSERCELPELEQIIVDSIKDVLKMMRKKDFTEKFSPCMGGDPLRDLLGL